MIDKFIEHSIVYRKILNKIMEQDNVSDALRGKWDKLIRLIDENFLIHCYKYN